MLCWANNKKTLNNVFHCFHPICYPEAVGGRVSAHLGTFERLTALLGVIVFRFSSALHTPCICSTRTWCLCCLGRQVARFWATAGVTTPNWREMRTQWIHLWVGSHLIIVTRIWTGNSDLFGCTEWSKYYGHCHIIHMISLLYVSLWHWLLLMF